MIAERDKTAQEGVTCTAEANPVFLLSRQKSYCFFFSMTHALHLAAKTSQKPERKVLVINKKIQVQFLTQCFFSLVFVYFVPGCQDRLSQ